MAVLFWRNRHEIRDDELNAFVDGELDESARLHVERHMESCASCRETVAELRAVTRAMSELPAVRAPRSFALREADVRPTPASGDTGLFGSVTPLLSGVAAIAIVAFVVLVGIDITEQTTSDFGDSANRATSLESEQMASLAPGVEDVTVQEFYAADGEREIEGGVPSQGVETFTFGDDLSDNESDLPAVGNSDGRLDNVPDVLPEEIEEEPQSGGLGQAYAGDNIVAAPADDGGSTGLRVAEGVAAAVAMAAIGSVLLLSWRNRTTAG